jgi:phenylacetate-coenzyme A ligase PaaK-like adenylate-forming protein
MYSDGHWQRVRDEVSRMIDEVPLYAGRPPVSGDLAAWLQSIPAITKRELRRGFPKSIVRRQQDLKAELQSGSIELVASGGTSEPRLQHVWEREWSDAQRRDAIALNRRVAEGQSRRAVLATPQTRSGATCHDQTRSREARTIDGALFLNQTADPTHWSPAELDRMIAEWNELRPEGVESDPAYLASLCRHAARSRQRLHSPGFVTLTYELATRGHRRAIRSVLDAPLFSLYGATETGVLFMECERGRLHHNARHSHIELVPTPNSEDGRARVLVTTLGRTWMPLLRYDLGDIVKPASECGCGLPSEGPLLERVEGRANDALTVNGVLRTPAELDDAIEAAEPLDAWQLVRDGERFLLHVVGGAGDKAARAVEKLLGAPIETRAEAAILPEPSGKYRLVKP